VSLIHLHLKWLMIRKHFCCFSICFPEVYLLLFMNCSKIAFFYVWLIFSQCIFLFPSYFLFCFLVINGYAGDYKFKTMTFELYQLSFNSIQNSVAINVHHLLLYCCLHIFIHYMSIKDLYLWLLNHVGNKKELKPKNIIILAFVSTYVVTFTIVLYFF